ncbi:MAG: pyruvate ferredoxin oxidoreductase, partial [Armatimonadetes bacterium]|nr:pyruvate ferredoxin oxidoreductase [Armatimonadota bacterium]
MSYDLFASGHTACAGCGQSLAMRLILEALGPKVIIAQATGCGEIFSSRYPQSAWGVPWIHSLFENTPAVASGIEAALKALNRDKEALVVAQGGDGGLGDIGFGALSGLFERGHNILVICYDNEAYMNTGIQRSG